MLDEKIAALMKENRRQKRDEEKRRSESSNNTTYTLEFITDCVKRGKVFFPYLIVDIAVRDLCDRQIKVPVPEGFFDGESIEADAFTFLNQQHQCCLTGKVIEKPDQRDSFEEWRNQIVQTLIQYNTYPRYESHSCLADRDYLCYWTQIKEDTFFNLSYRIFFDRYCLIGTARCFERRRGTMGRLLEVLVREISGDKEDGNE